MDDYISRRATLDALGVTKNATKYGGDHSGYDTRMLYEIHDALTGIPAADVVPVVHGRWVDADFCGQYECSECGNNAVDLYDFCPNCGAKMDGKRREE